MQLNYPNMNDAKRALKNHTISRMQYRDILDAHHAGRLPPQNTALGGAIGLHGIGVETQDKIEADPSFFEERVKKTNSEDEYLGTVRTWASYNKGPLQEFEFLARTLVVGSMGNDKIILASPIYVAMVD